MSLRIYIKGTPKFHSPKKGDSSFPMSPHFNPLPPSRITNASKKGSIIQTDSREASVMSEVSSVKNENPLKTLDENAAARGSRNSRKETESRIPKSRFSSCYEEEKAKRRNSNNPKELQQSTSNKKMEKVIKDFQKKLNNRENIPDRQIRMMLQDSEEVIGYLVRELETSKKALSETEHQNEALLKEKNALELGFQNMELKAYNKIHQQLEARYMKEYGPKKNDQDIHLLQENLRLEEKIGKVTDSYQKLMEEFRSFKEKASQNENIMQRERESFLLLKNQVEALLDANDDLSMKLKCKEDERVRRLEKELRDAKAHTEKLLKEVYGKNQIIEELRKSMVVADFQSPIQHNKTRRVGEDITNMISPYGGEGGTNACTWSTFRMESPREIPTEKGKEEDHDSKKKIEVLKNDNTRLLKMVESNQKIIKGLKDAFAELEKKNSARFEEIVSFYEKKLKGITEEKKAYHLDKDYRGYNQDNTTTKMTSGTMNSLSSSQLHSKKGSSESVWKDKSDLQTLYN